MIEIDKQTEILLGKMYRGLALSTNEIKELLNNPFEEITKCELIAQDGLIYYKFYLANDASKCIGEVIFK